MDYHKLIIEGLRKEELDEKYLGIVGEEAEWKPLWFENVNEEAIDEASAITFNGKAFPKSGWCLIMAGGSGSGKGFVIDKQVLINAKIMDVDKLKKLYNKVISKKEGLPKDKPKYDLGNPEDVAYLHAFVKKKGWKDLSVDWFFDQRGGKTELANVIFDITGKSEDSIRDVAMRAHDMGYKISLAWVVTNREVAIIRNFLRDRVVPESDFHRIHNEVNKTIIPFLKNSNLAKYLQEAWIVFSGPAVAEVEDMNSNPSVKDELKDRVFKLIRKGKAFTTFTNIKGAVVDIGSKIVEWLGMEEVTGDGIKKGAKKKYRDFDDIKSDIEKLEYAGGKAVPGQMVRTRR